VVRDSGLASTAFSSDSSPSPGPGRRKRIGKRERGVLTLGPYKGELVPLWRSTTLELATVCSNVIYKTSLACGRATPPGATWPARFSRWASSAAAAAPTTRGAGSTPPVDEHRLEKGTGDPVKTGSGQLCLDGWKNAETMLAYAKVKTECKGKHG
jgi:hypothetical protein